MAAQTTSLFPYLLPLSPSPLFYPARLLIRTAHDLLQLITLINTNNNTMVNIPKDQQAIIFEANGAPLKYGKIPVAKPGFDEVLINILYSGQSSPFTLCSC